MTDEQAGDMTTEVEDTIATIDWLLGAWTLAELAERTGVSVSTLRRMQTGKATDRTWAKLSETIRALADEEQQEIPDYWTGRP